MFTIPEYRELQQDYERRFAGHREPIVLYDFSVRRLRARMRHRLSHLACRARRTGIPLAPRECALPA